MQIVRDLGGYSLGRSDLVRRAMSKKKAEVMEEERANFVNGNEAEKVSGCISKGIPAEVANKIFDSMISFAAYAFNKSHAACYAVVAYQTAYLKHYYPTQFMAALMTSVLDNTGKVSEYIQVCRQMGISILPPDINEGYSGFSVSGSNIRYGLSAIKNVGRPVIEAIVSERKLGGEFKNIRDLLTRLGGEVNKRCVENFIKAGALDSFGANRRQLISVYANIMDDIASERKNSVAGQMSLFDFVPEEDKQHFDVKLPNVAEFSKDMILGFEKEVMSVYVSGHPLEEYEKLWKRTISAKSSDFRIDAETGECQVKDNQRIVAGGIVAEKNVRLTKTGKHMANVVLEDLVGTVNMIVWPSDYDKYGSYLVEDAKIFVRGRVQAKEDQDAEIICESITPFDEMPKETWVQFENLESYNAEEKHLFELIHDSNGRDMMVIYLKAERMKKVLPANMSVRADDTLLQKLSEVYGKDNVRIV